MSQLFEARKQLETIIADRKLDLIETMGKIALKTGFVLVFITPTTPDDPEKIEKLKKSVQEVLGCSLHID